MRISDWSSDVCSSDLFTSNAAEGPRSRDKATGLSLSEQGLGAIKGYEKFRGIVYPDQAGHLTVGYGHKLQPGEDKQFAAEIDAATAMALLEIGRASWRDRGGQYGEISVVAVYLKKKKDQKK